MKRILKENNEKNNLTINPDIQSILTTYLGNQTIQKFTQTMFSERSNDTDLWWENLDKAVEAASILQEIEVMNYKIG